jgi:hypothetical protein
LRSGGITAAYAVGVPLERIMRLSNHASLAVVMRHYLDPLVPPTPAARVFFQRFVPSSRSLPLPAAPVSLSVGNPSAAELSIMLLSVPSLPYDNTMIKGAPHHRELRGSAWRYTFNNKPPSTLPDCNKADQKSDFLTKPLKRVLFQRACKLLHLTG